MEDTGPKPDKGCAAIKELDGGCLCCGARLSYKLLEVQLLHCRASNGQGWHRGNLANRKSRTETFHLRRNFTSR